MATTPNRVYNSTIRRRQADETRSKIAAAARTLLIERGYARTTIDAIAAAAEVSVPTVYATFRSKAGIVGELLDAAMFGPEYDEVVAQARATADPIDRIPWAARIARIVHEGQSREFDALKSVGAVPELGELERDRECRRYDAQQPMIHELAERGRLRADLDETSACDVLWALTGRQLYLQLVVDRGWSPDRYETWLAESLASALLK